MAEISLYDESINANNMALADRVAVDQAGQERSTSADIEDDLAREQAQWRATKLTLIIVLVILGIEQVIPLSDALRSQIGVLTVLLAFGFWNLLCGTVRPSGKKQ